MKHYNIFILLGAPGSGKGSLATKCVQEFGWVQLSTGNLCRDHIERGTLIGKHIQSIIESGQLVAYDIIADMIIDWLVSRNDLPKNIIFDGYPRTKKQAEILCDLLKNKLCATDLLVIKLNIDSSLLTERIINRITCSNKECGRVYSTSVDRTTQPKVSNICDSCGSSLIKRIDDTMQSLEKRLCIYDQHEKEIIDFYVDQGVCIHFLNGAQDIKKVFDDFKKLVFNYVC